MKPISILLTIVLGLASLSLVVWIGQYQAGGFLPGAVGRQEPTSNDLSVPKSGPFGTAETDEVEYNFGTKMVGASDDHTFTIKNGGKGPLELKLGKPTCQCTVGEISKVGGDGAKPDSVKPGDHVSLAPDESVNIVVKWVMKAELEQFRQVVPVFTTDPNRREIELIVTGVVDTLFQFRPATIWDIGEISKSEPTTARGLAISTVLDEFTLSEVPREASPVKISWEPATQDLLDIDKAKSGYLITVEVSPNIPIGLFRETIKLKAIGSKAKAEAEKTEPAKNNGEKVEEKVEADKTEADKAVAGTADPSNAEFIQEFTVLGRRIGPIEVHAIGAGFTIGSNRLIFGDFPAAVGKKAKLTLFVKEMDDDLVVKSIESPDPRISVKFLGAGKILGKTKSYQVEVEILPGPAVKHRDLAASAVDLMLNHPDAPDFKLLVDYNATR